MIHWSFPIHDPLEVARFAYDSLGWIAIALFWAAIPLALLPPVPLTWGWIWVRTILITLAVWAAFFAFFNTYEVPFNQMVRWLEKGEPDVGYDGTAVNAILLLFGWAPPFFQCLITLWLTRLVFRKIIHRRKPPAETPVAVDS